MQRATPGYSQPASIYSATPIDDAARPNKVDFPHRPWLPYSLSALISSVLTARCLMRRGSVNESLLVACAGALTLMVCHFFYRYFSQKTGTLHHGQYRRIVSFVFGLCIAGVSSAGALYTLDVCAQTLAENPVSKYRIDITSDAYKTRFNTRYQGHIWLQGLRAEVWITSSQELERGDKIYAVGRFVSYQHDTSESLPRAQKTAGTLHLAHLIQKEKPKGLLGFVLQLRSKFLELLAPQDSDEGAVLAALVLGYREGLQTRKLKNYFTACGAAHLIAVSGSHLAVVGALTELLAEQYRLNVRLRMLLILGLSGLYCMVCGLPVSALRAWIMLASSQLAHCVGRRAHALSGLGICGIIMLALNPALSSDLGFLLSLSSVAALNIYSRYTTYCLRRAFPAPIAHRLKSLSHRKFPLAKQLYAYVAQIPALLATSLVAQTASAALVISSFSSYPVLGVFANLVISPLIATTLALGLVALCVAPIPVLGPVLLKGAYLMARLVCGLAQNLSKLPFVHVLIAQSSAALIALVYVSLAAYIYCFWPQPTKLQIRLGVALPTLLCAGLIVVWRYFAPARVVVLDVGQGDAILVQEGAHALLIDAGPDDAIIDALARAHVLHLDAVLITHLHDDHYAGLTELQALVDIDEVLFAQGVSSELPQDLATTLQMMQVQISELSYQDRFWVSNFCFTHLWPRTPVDGSENAHSVILSMTRTHNNDAFVALFTGDAEQDELRELLRAKDVGAIDMLKLGHHGSAVSLSGDEARVLRPRLAIASAGKHNRYGHPTQDCIELIRSVNCQFFCTIDAGDIELRWKGSKTFLNCSASSP